MQHVIYSTGKDLVCSCLHLLTYLLLAHIHVGGPE